MAFTYTKVDEAIAAIQSEAFHVAIIDLKLRDGDARQQRVDEFEGYRLVMELERYGWLKKMVICVVSHWSDIAQLKPFMRRSPIEMDKARRSLSSGVEVNDVLYFSKNEYQAERLWERIHEELVKKGLYTSSLLQQLDILEVLAHRMSRNMIDHIESESEHSKLAKEDEWLREFYDHNGEAGLQARLKREIADLLMRWAEEVKAEDITLYQIGSGFSKATVVKAHRMVNKRWELPVIIKMGYHREIENEREAYKKLVRRFVLRVPPAENGASTFCWRHRFTILCMRALALRKPITISALKNSKCKWKTLAKNCSLWYQAKYQRKTYGYEYMDYLHCYLPRFKGAIEHLQKQREAGGETFWNRERICFPAIEGDFSQSAIAPRTTRTACQ